MSWESAISTGITILAISALSIAAKRGGAKKPPLGDGRKWLGYGGAFKAVGVVGIVVSLALAIISWFQPANVRMYPAWMAVGFLGLSAPLVLELFLVRIGFNNENVMCYSPWRKDRVIRWDEFETCTFSEVNKWWVVKTKSQGFVRLHQALVGHEEFLTDLKARGIEFPDGF